MSQKESLIMIHGLLGSLSFFKPDNYLRDITVYTPEMHGYGSTPCLKNLTLQDQADMIEQIIVDEIQQPVWLLGHSVGGAIAVMLAAKRPELVNGMINVEGNFTLNDAFWCQTIASSASESWLEAYAELSSDPDKWLRESNIAVTEERIDWAKDILAFQTAQCAQQVADAVVKETTGQFYVDALNSVLKSHLPIHLIAGEHSRKSWDVPEAYVESCSSFTVIENTGHMMMLERPATFCNVVRNIISGKASQPTKGRMTTE